MVDLRKLANKSPAELWFRLKQQFWNFKAWRWPPKLSSSLWEQVEFSDPLPAAGPVFEALQASQFRNWILEVAEAYLCGEVEIFNDRIKVEERIDWHRDYIHSRRAPLKFSPTIRYLSFEEVGDHKVIWELNRHSHLVVLALAYGFTGDQRYFREIERQLIDWIEANPPLEGINWCSALEVGFRLLNWIWVCHFLPPELRTRLLEAILESVYQQALFLSHNLSYYFSPNTHLLGEAVALHAAGIAFPNLPGASEWRDTGRKVVLHELERQVNSDGSHFEGSSYYHLYAFDMFLFHHILDPMPELQARRLSRMAWYLKSLVGASGSLPFIGDDDGGRLFLPFGDRRRFALSSLATAGVLFDQPEWVFSKEVLAEQAVWWLGAQSLAFEGRWENRIKPRVFPEAGVAVLGNGKTQILIRTGTIARGSGGHSHADALSVVLRANNSELLIDPGTFSYVQEHWRELFRGVVGHNTVRIDGKNQAEPSGAFRWRDRPEVKVEAVVLGGFHQQLVASCHYRIKGLEGVRHRRYIIWITESKTGEGILFVADEITGHEELHRLEQFWHLGVEAKLIRRNVVQLGTEALLVTPPGVRIELIVDRGIGWRSEVYGKRQPAPVIHATVRRHLPAVLWTVFDLAPTSTDVEVKPLEGRGVGCIYRRAEKRLELIIREPGTLDLEITAELSSVSVTGRVHGKLIRRQLARPVPPRQASTQQRRGQGQGSASGQASHEDQGAISE